MSTIRRSLTSPPSVTVQSGDVTIVNQNSGIVMTDNVGADNRLKIIDDAGTKTLVIEEIE